MDEAGAVEENVDGADLSDEGIDRLGGATWERVVYEVWEYQLRETCLTFAGVRLVSWETGRTDCTPPPPRESASGGAGRQPPPFPPYPQ